jgi:hypothetical protein
MASVTLAYYPGIASTVTAPFDYTSSSLLVSPDSAIVVTAQALAGTVSVGIALSLPAATSSCSAVAGSVTVSTTQSGSAASANAAAVAGSLTVSSGASAATSVTVMAVGGSVSASAVLAGPALSCVAGAVPGTVAVGSALSGTPVGVTAQAVAGTASGGVGPASVNVVAVPGVVVIALSLPPVLVALSAPAGTTRTPRQIDISAALSQSIAVGATLGQPGVFAALSQLAVDAWLERNPDAINQTGYGAGNFGAGPFGGRGTVITWDTPPS